MSDLVGKPEDRFSHNVAHIISNCNKAVNQKTVVNPNLNSASLFRIHGYFLISQNISAEDRFSRDAANLQYR